MSSFRRNLLSCLAICLGLMAAVGATTASAECTILPGGTLGDPEPSPVPDRAGSPTDKGPGARGANPTVDGLPSRVDLKTSQLSSNRNHYFGLRGGRLYVKPNFERTGERGPWEHVETPACLDGDIKAIGADDDELVAINSENAIFGMDQALSTPSRFNWTSRWGFPFWTGPGFTVPADSPVWSWTVISPRESEYWVDPAGNRHPVGEGKVSHILSVSKDRRRITMNDPWLPLDRSYEVCTPLRGGIKIQNLSTSGSVLFAIDQSGGLYTRLWDFDIAGLDNLFFRYSYEDQRGVSDPAIQLPGAHWVRQPRIPGTITDRISITTVGRGTEHRTLRVEGRDKAGRPGFWEKDLYKLNAPGAWKFVSTPKAKLLGKPLANPAGDIGRYAPRRNEDARYVLTEGGFSGEIPDFNISCNLSVLRVNLSGGEPLDLDLHLDDQIRILPRARGLDDEPRQVAGTIEVTDRARAVARRNPAAKQFITEHFGDSRFTPVPIDATTDEISIPSMGWKFGREADPEGGMCVVDPGFRTVRLSPAGRNLKFAFETATESPASIEISRVTGKRAAKGKVQRRLVRTGSFTWKDRRPKRADGIYKVRISSLGRGGREDIRGFTFRRKNSRYTSLNGSRAGTVRPSCAG
ncbi:MAG TPA: hypothetical protein VMF31_04445 [Solirubrobacterales bacterium]|nr:hypothetical protein [Solirubrobacterales bacterium]